VTGGKSIAFLLQSVSDVSAINPLVAFYLPHVLLLFLLLLLNKLELFSVFDRKNIATLIK
jgi:hypothetical protein